mmetsp:Transcript_13114/g.45867  ORF Transcript_13114/g.45867 Transcript_13114/m.45867 type:complete len:142 (-) Transcript_13114:135-560(-)
MPGSGGGSGGRGSRGDTGLYTRQVDFVCRDASAAAAFGRAYSEVLDAFATQPGHIISGLMLPSQNEDKPKVPEGAARSIIVFRSKREFVAARASAAVNAAKRNVFGEKPPGPHLAGPPSFSDWYVVASGGRGRSGSWASKL